MVSPSDSGRGVLVRRAFSVLLGCALVGAFLIANAPTAGAADASGCSGSGVSIGDQGEQIDRASAPGDGATEDNPFDIVTTGKVNYKYSMSRSPAGGTWRVDFDLGVVSDVFGNPGFSGKVKSSSGQSGNGVEPLKKHLKIGGLAAVAGAFQVTITVKDSTGKKVCTVSGWIRIHASVFTTPAFYLALIFLIIAFFLAFIAMGKPYAMGPF